MGILEWDQESVFVTSTANDSASLEDLILEYIFKSEVYFLIHLDFMLLQPDSGWHDSPTSIYIFKGLAILVSAFGRKHLKQQR